MKTRLSMIAGFMGWLVCTSAFADNRAEPSATPKAAAAPQAPADPQWSIRMVLLVVDMPEAKATALYPDLINPGKINAALEQIVSAVQNKEATLVGAPVLQLIDGAPVNTEDVFEKRYATEFTGPTTVRMPVRQSSPAASPGNKPAEQQTEERMITIPGAFETRNTGLSVNARGHVVANGNWILLQLSASDVIQLGFDPYLAGIKQPRFVTLKTDTTMAVKNGQNTFVGFHKMPAGKDVVEVEMLQAEATAIK